jgi:hypothetical protein
MLRRIMLPCSEVTRIYSEELERTLRLGERASVRLHRLACTGCTHYRRQLWALRRVMNAYADGEAPPLGNPPDGSR